MNEKLNEKFDERYNLILKYKYLYNIFYIPLFSLSIFYFQFYYISNSLQFALMRLITYI